MLDEMKKEQIENGEGLKISPSIGCTVMGPLETNTEWKLDCGILMRLIRQSTIGAHIAMQSVNSQHTGSIIPGITNPKGL
jgi:hypothetical protein